MKILHTVNTLPSGPASSLLLLELEQLSSELGKHLFLLESHAGWWNSLLSQSFPRISIAIWIRYVSMFSGTNILISLILLNSVKDEKIRFKNKSHTAHPRKPMSWKWWDVLGEKRRKVAKVAKENVPLANAASSMETGMGYSVRLTPAGPLTCKITIRSVPSTLHKLRFSLSANQTTFPDCF